MNKASGGDGIPVELFQILKDDTVKVLHSICQQIQKTQQWPQDWKRSVCFQSNTKERQCQRMFKLPHNQTHLTYQSKVIIKIHQARLQQYVNMNFQMFKLDLEKAEEPGIKLPTSVGSSKKQENSWKRSTSALLTMPKPLTVWITTKCGKFLKRQEYQTT